MSRRVILILIVIMVLVMTSLILVQTNSILKALHIKEEQFNSQVNSALTKVVINSRIMKLPCWLLKHKVLVLQETMAFSPGIFNNQSLNHLQFKTIPFPTAIQELLALYKTKKLSQIWAILKPIEFKVNEGGQATTPTRLIEFTNRMDLQVSNMKQDLITAPAC